MQLSESKLFTIEALNRIEGFAWPESADYAAHASGSGDIVFWNEFLGSAVLVSKLSSDFISGINSLITKAEFDSVDGWVRHDNSECPANSESLVQVKMGGLQVGNPSPSHIAKSWAWVNGGITQWRYHKPTKESAMTTTKPSCIETLISKRKDALEQKRLALVALEEAEAAEHGFMLAIEAWAESHGFDIRLLDESEEKPDQQDSELVITDWRDLQKGDVVKAILVNGASHVNGRVGFVKRIDESAPDGPLFVKFDSVNEWWVKEWKFVRRPQ